MSGSTIILEQFPIDILELIALAVREALKLIHRLRPRHADMQSDIHPPAVCRFVP